MTTKTVIALSAGIVLGTASGSSAASVPSAGALPSIDLQKICRASEAAPFADSTATFDICMSHEQAARKKLAEDWENVPAIDKAHCVLPAEYLPGYIEWLTRLEMERDFRKIRQQQPDEQPARVPPGRGPLAAHTLVSREGQCSEFQAHAARMAENELTKETVLSQVLHPHRSKPCRY
jgi:hypothetical protein